MKGLYWKIFIWFWAAMILIMLATALYSSYFFQRNYKPERMDELLNFYAIAAAGVYDSGGPAALNHWINHVKPPIKMKMKYVIIEPAGSAVPVKRNIKPKAHRRFSESRAVKTKDGQRLQLIAKLPSPRQQMKARRISYFMIRTVFAILIAGIICYLLSLYLTRPLRKLKTAARKIAAGELSTRVSNTIGNRRDEISELANEFDQMAEKIEKSMTAQRELLQHVSHELRSPLSRLQVSLELARRRSQGDIDKELDRIGLETEKLNELIGEILSLSRLQYLNENQFQDIDMIELIKNIVDNVNFEFSQVALPVKLTHNVDSYPLQANKKLLQRAIENILRNAYRYSSVDKAIELSIKACTKPKSLTIDIRDYGPGVQNKDLSHIFTPFYRAKSSHQEDGYGLGLAIAKQAIRLHMGDIKASNQPPTGLLVSIKLPYHS